MCMYVRRAKGKGEGKVKGREKEKETERKNERAREIERELPLTIKSCDLLIDGGSPSYEKESYKATNGSNPVRRDVAVHTETDDETEKWLGWRERE